VKRTRTTLADVAKLAGVSIATASKVLNDREDVAEDTRRRVRQAVHDTDYAAPRRVPVTAGVSERLIEVCFPEWQNAYETAVIDGVTAEAESEGLEVVIGPRAHDNRVEFDPASLRRRGRVGAIFVTVDASLPPIRTLSDSGFPVAVVDPVRVGRTQCITIGATNFTGGVTATEHLLALGHRRIAHAGGPEVECSQARVAGYLSGCAGQECRSTSHWSPARRSATRKGARSRRSCSIDPIARPRSSRPATTSPSASWRRRGDGRSGCRRT
jgi:LacI family transcriptional regulator